MEGGRQALECSTHQHTLSPGLMMVSPSDMSCRNPDHIGRWGVCACTCAHVCTCVRAYVWLFYFSLCFLLSALRLSTLHDLPGMWVLPSGARVTKLPGDLPGVPGQWQGFKHNPYGLPSETASSSSRFFTSISSAGGLPPHLRGFGPVLLHHSGGSFCPLAFSLIL